MSYVIRRHQQLLKPLIRIPHFHTIIDLQRPQRLNLIMQMACQRLRKSLDQLLHLLTVKTPGFACLCILVKHIEPRREGAVLLDILLHQPLYARNGLDAREKFGFLGVVVVVHGFAPALAVGEEVADSGGIGGGDVGRLEEYGVEATDHAVVGEGHLRRDVVCGVRGLGRVRLGTCRY
jgi:hypothetical protein